MEFICDGGRQVGLLTFGVFVVIARFGFFVDDFAFETLMGD